MKTALYEVEVWTRATKTEPARLLRVERFEVSCASPAGYACHLALRMGEVTGHEWRIVKESKA